MTKADIGPKIGIDGEKEFKRQIKEINAVYKETVSETKAVMSAFIGNEHSIEALTASTAQLGKENDILDSRMAELENQLEKYTAAGLESSNAARILRTQLNNTTAEFNKNEAQIKQNEEEIKQLTDAQNENGESTSVLSGLMKKYGLDLDSIGRKMGLSKEQTTALSEALGGSGFGGAASLAVGAAAATAAIALTAAAVKEITKFMVEAVNAATDYADNISTLSTNFHIATDTLQEYQYMAELTDTSLDTITGSLSKLTRSMNEARNSGLSDTFIGSNYQIIGNAADAFRRLGIEVTDSSGELRDANEVFLEAIDRLGYIQNETERDALSFQIFGKTAMELNSLIATGKDGIAAFAQEAHEMNYVLGSDQMEALKELGDEYARFDREMEAIKNQIAAEMAPALLDLAQQLLEVAKSVDWNEFGRNAATIIENLTPLIVNATQAVADLAEGLANLSNALNGSVIGSALKTGSKFALNSMLNNIPGVSTARNLISTASTIGSALGIGGSVTMQMDGYTIGKAATPYINASNYTRGGGL